MTTVPAITAFRQSFRALRYPNYRLFFSGQIISVTGTWMQSVAQGWLMHRLTASAFMLGLLGFAQFLPVMLFSLWAGVLVDRADKRRLIIATQSLALVQAVLLAIIVSMDVVEPWMVIALALFFGLINAFDLPARQSFIVEMVGKDDLPNAIALNSASFNSARIVGPMVAGLLLAVYGEATCFWLNAVSYLAVIAALWRMQMPRAASTKASFSLSTFREGVEYARGVRQIRNLLLLLGLTAGLGFQYMVLLPVYAREILRTDAGGYGLMVSAFGLGSLLAAVRMTRKHDRWQLRRNLLFGLITAGAGMLGFAWSRLLPLTLAMGFAAGFGLILYVISTNTLIQLTTEDRFRGRVMSFYTFVFIGTAPLGALVSGWIAQMAGAPAATTLSAAVLLGGAGWVFLRLRALAAREMREVGPRHPQPAASEKMG